MKRVMGVIVNSEHLNGARLFFSNSNMKKLGILLVGIVFVACGNLDDDISIQHGSSQSALSTKVWNLYAYETGAVNHPTTIAFKAEKNEKGDSILSGKCGLNFYEATFKIYGDSTIKILSLSTTEIGGSLLEMKFEEDFYERISTIETFYYEMNNLILSTHKGSKLYFK